MDLGPVLGWIYGGVRHAAEYDGWEVILIFRRSGVEAHEECHLLLTLMGNKDAVLASAHGS